MLLPLLLCLVVVLLLAAAVLSLTAFETKTRPGARDVFGFAAMRHRSKGPPPPVEHYAARDSEDLPYRFYDSPADRILIFVHGSSYHGAGYHDLALAVSASGAAKVVLPTLRGHYLAGLRRGDVDYIGQLEDDIADLITHLRAKGLKGPVFLGGHSSGGGFALRFAGGPHGAAVAGCVLLSPVIPARGFMRGGTSGGWANLNLRRLIGLILLNRVGIHGFDGLHVIDFNKPVVLRDGTETLSYSHRLNASLHPHLDYKADLRALPTRSLVLVGDLDQAVDARALRESFTQYAPKVEFRILDGIDHFGVFRDPQVLASIAEWIMNCP